MLKKLMLSIMLCAAAAGARADVTLGSPFTDNMVLQRGVVLPVWGTAAPGEMISLAFAGQHKEGKAGADGNWIVKLDPLTASSVPAELTVTGKTRITLSNVVVGEVWICSGQSNMELKVSAAANAEKEISGAQFPAIRLLSVPRVPSYSALKEMHGAQWKVCSHQKRRTQ